MKATVSWREAMVFEGEADGHKVLMDAKAPIGKGGAPTPKEMLLFGLGGCTSMDVIALLKKNRQSPQSFAVEVDVTVSSGEMPTVFESARLNYLVIGAIEPEKLVEAVRLSQSRYCGVSAMLSMAFPIHFSILLNGVEVGSGLAEFT